MLPISQLVIKAHDLCNLSCKYCYVYNEETYVKARRKRLTTDILRQRLSELLLQHGATVELSPQLEVTFHGGEPTLVGVSRFSEMVAVVRTMLQASVPRLRVSMTTNGTLFDDAWAAHFAAHPSLGLAISMDGPMALQNKSRVRVDGGPSFDEAYRGLRTAITHGLDPTVLAVIDPDSDPVDLLDFFTSNGVTKADLLLPETLGCGARSERSSALTAYLLRAFEYWSSSAAGAVRIRLFDTLIGRLLGYETPNCTLGPGCTGILTIHADGDLSGCDVLGSKAAPGRARIETIADWAAFVARVQDSAYGRSIAQATARPKPCEGCRFWFQCGGYCLATRIDAIGRELEGQTTPHCGPLYALMTRMSEHVEHYVDNAHDRLAAASS